MIKVNNKFTYECPTEKKLVENGYDGTIFLTDSSYDTALIGVSADGRVIYDYDKMVEWLINEDGMSKDDAAEFIDFNVIGALPYMGEKAPIIMHNLI